MRKFTTVKELLGDGDRTEANPGTYHNVLVESGPAATICRPNQVVVEVYAATINYPDLLQTVGGYQATPELPYTPGGEGAGVVKMVGGDVKTLKVGDRVTVSSPAGPMGCMQSEIVLPESACWKFPDHYTYAEASGFSTGYVTAYHCLVERANLKKGETVLIHGATGGMGMAAVHVAKAIGAAVIIGTGGTDEKLEVVRQQGATHVINYNTEKQFRDTVKKASPSGDGVDVIFDPVGGTVFEESLRCCRFGCRIAVVGFTSGVRPTARTNQLLIKGISLLGCRAGESVRQGIVDEKARMATLRRWAAEGVIKPHVSHFFPIEDAAAGFRAMWDRQVVGRAVIAPFGEAAAKQTGAQSKL